MTFSSLAPDPIRDDPREQKTAHRDPQKNGQLADLALRAGDLAGEFSLEPLLERILRNAVELLHCTSGSICTIDAEQNTYRKEADLGVGCRSGEVFPLDEGVTGAVVHAGAPVAFRRYSAVPGGHIRADDVRHSRAVLGAPIRLGGVIVGACVVFGSDIEREFDESDMQLLELFTIHAAVAIANSRMLSGESSLVRNGSDPHLTTRELQVNSFLKRGWPDKLIATELGISSKTVEKHVGTILRKTGARNRAEVAARIASSLFREATGR